MSKDSISIIVPVDDEELHKALLYLAMKDSGMTDREVADHFGINERTLYGWRDRWMRSGISRRAREIYLTPKIEAMLLALDQAASAIPRAFERLIDIATNDEGKYKASDQITAIKTLVNLVTQRVNEGVFQPVEAEFNYLQSQQPFDLDI